MRLSAIWLLFTVGMSVVGAGGMLRTQGHRPEVTILRTPDNGIQPQATVGPDGVVHLVYFKGDDNAGDIYYVRKAPRDSDFSRPMRVNGVPGSAVAIGSVRGAQIALGRGDRVHVAWLGSDKAQPRGPGNATPMLYTRLNDAGSAFEPQRNVMQFAVGLDGGGSVAADQFGNVYVVWHGNPDKNGEANRRVWVAQSHDEGKTFEPEVLANRHPTGACGCCGIRAFADDRGALYILYRAAEEGIHRDMYLLSSMDQGRSFKEDLVSKWELNACPMTTGSISAAGTVTLIAWQTEGQVYYASLRRGTHKVARVVAAPGPAVDRRFPAVVGSAQGDVLLAWTEGTAWKRGGSLAWQVFDSEGKPNQIKGSAPGVPVWGLVAAFPKPQGGFVIMY